MERYVVEWKDLENVLFQNVRIGKCTFCKGKGCGSRFRN
jgi:hypothetical protein